MKENAELIVIGLSISCGEKRQVKFGVLFISCLALKIWLCPIRHIHIRTQMLVLSVNYFAKTILQPDREFFIAPNELHTSKCLWTN